LIVTAQRGADGLDVGAVLRGEAESDGQIAHHRADRAACLVIVDEQLGDAAVVIAADARGELQAIASNSKNSAGSAGARAS
jgi:hypothetical protein